MRNIDLGTKVKNFKLPDQNGQEVSLDDYKGKWVIVYFYPKDNTPGCTTEAKDFTCREGDFSDKNAVILGISPDNAASHLRFINKHDIKLKLLSDLNHEVMEKFGAWGLKKLYGREFMGVIRSTFLIDPEGKLAFKWPKVKVKVHVDDVFNKLSELIK